MSIHSSINWSLPVGGSNNSINSHTHYLWLYNPNSAIESLINEGVSLN